MHKGVWTVKCRRGSTVKVCVCVCYVCVRTCVSQCVGHSVSHSVGLLLPHDGCSLCRGAPLAREFLFLCFCLNVSKMIKGIS